MRTLRPYTRPKPDEITVSGVTILWSERDDSYLRGREHYNHAPVVYPCCGKRKIQHNASFGRYRKLNACMCDACRHKTVVQSAHPNWKGGVTTSHGYRYLNINSLASKDQDMARDMTSTHYILEHRLVMAVSLGRPLEHSEHVHHDNGKKTDNRLENLVLMSSDKHASEHWKTRLELEAALKRIEWLEAQMHKVELGADPAVII